VRNTDQLPVCKHDARALVAIVEDDVDAGILQRLVEPGRFVAHEFGLAPADATDHHLERRDCRRPDDSALIVVLLDGSTDNAGHPDAVAAHLEVLRLAVDIEEARIHGLRILVAEIEHMTHLDAALDGEHALAIG